MHANDAILIAALVLLALCGNLIGFPFWPSLGFTLALGLVFYLIQTSYGKKHSGGEES